jgi:uncharacterized protein
MLPHPTAFESKFTALAIQPDADTGTFSGYAARFNTEDLGHDIILPGAFRTSLAARKADGIRMLFQHDPAEPIGVWDELHEDALGLYAKGHLLPDVARAREVLALIRGGAVDGLSIGFRAVRASKDAKTGLRRISEIDLWEISIVTFPMQPDARIAMVKSHPFAGRTPTSKEFERWLTRDAGFSRSEARALSAHGLKGLSATRNAGLGINDERRLISTIQAATRLLQPACALRA